MKETVVYRQLALPVTVFDHIKDVQRAHKARSGVALSINETVSRIVRDHQQTAAREVRNHDQQVPAVLR